MAYTLKEMKALYPNDPMRQRLIDNFLDGSESVILPMLSFVDSSDALAYNFVSEDNLGEIGERSLNGEYDVSADSSSPKREVLSLFGGAIRTDNVFIDAKGDVARLNKIDRRMRAAGKYFDRQFFLGDSKANAKQFAGLRARSVARERILWAGTNGGALTLDLLDEALDSVSGENGSKVIFCDRWMRRKVSSLCRSSTNAKFEFDDRRQLQAYDGAVIKTISEDHKRNPIFTFTEERGTSKVTGSLYVARFGGSVDEDHLQGIKGPSFMKLRSPVNMGEYVKDVIDNVLGLVDFTDNCFMRIGGILKQ
ncbi:MAG: major capsid protein [Bacillota bacterium]